MSSHHLLLTTTTFQTWPTIPDGKVTIDAEQWRKEERGKRLPCARKPQASLHRGKLGVAGRTRHPTADRRITTGATGLSRNSGGRLACTGGTAALQLIHQQFSEHHDRASERTQLSQQLNGRLRSDHHFINKQTGADTQYHRQTTTSSDERRLHPHHTLIMSVHSLEAGRKWKEIPSSSAFPEQRR